MANTNAPFGFRQWSGLGSAPTYEHVTVSLDYNASAIFYGDPVAPAADGTFTVASAVTSAAGIGGVFAGCKYLSVAQKRTVWSNYWPGSDVAAGNFVEAQIINDPNARFIAQADATGLALVDANATIDFAIGAGNTATGISGAYLDSTTLNGSANNPFRVISIYNAPVGNPGSLQNGQAYDYAIVAFNNIATKNFTGV